MPINNRMNLLGDAIQLFERKIILTLFVIGIISISIKLFFFPYGVPIAEDGLLYFRYAVDTSILGHLPETHLINNGWPLFLSPFFSMLHSNNFLDHMTIQRAISVLISTSTIVPVYFLARRFFEPKYALLGGLLYALEPRTIQNSLLGITEPLFILLTTSTLVLFLSSRKEIIYSSFGVAALATQVRYEGIVLFFLISILYFVRYRKEKKDLAKYGIALCVFILVMLPMSYARIATTGSDGIFESVSGGAQVYGIEAIASQENNIYGIFSYIFAGFQALIKYFGWIMIPYFVFFVPFGMFLMLKNRSEKSFFIICTIIILSIPALYAYSRGIQETRYLYILYPIFCVISIFAIKFLQERIKKILLVIIIGVILSSIVFLSIKNADYEHETEAFEIAKHVASTTNVINAYYPESKYVRVTGMLDEFPILSTSVSFGPKVISVDSQTLHEFIEKNRDEGLDHLVIDEKADRAMFLTDVFNNDEKYTYLTKIFDSKDLGYEYHVKIYKINYEKFDLSNQ